MKDFLLEYWQWIVGTLVIGSGLIGYLVKIGSNKVSEILIYDWLSANTENKSGSRFKSSKTISSNVNLPISKVEDICHKSKRIRLSTGQKNGMWTLREYDVTQEQEDDEEESPYNKRGAMGL